jgi:hypothetical protein
MATTPQSAQGASVPPAGAQALNPKQLALASVSSVLGGVMGAAFGGGTVMTFVAMAVAPWLTAFVEHPGPHRRRRVALVVLLALLISACRKAFASVLGRRTSATTDTAARAREARQLRGVALTGAVAVAIAVLVMTTGELAAGQALRGDRDTTLFGGGNSGSHGPNARAPVDPEFKGSSERGSGERQSGRPSLRLPDRIVATSPDSGGRRVTYGASAVDGDGNALMPVCSPPSGAVFVVGDTRVRCTVTDGEGRRAEGGFVVTVRRGGAPRRNDTKAPTLGVPDNFTRETETASDDGLDVTYLVTASDDRDGALTPTCRPASGTRFDLGRTRVKCSATDAAGHTTRASFIVTVARADEGEAADTTPPVIRVPSNLQRTATGPEGRRIAYYAAATDDRDGMLRPVCDPPSGSVFAIGTRTVRCTATNRAGLAASRSFAVEVIDGPPVLRISSPVRVRATSERGTDVTFAASATDAVDGVLKPDCEPPSGSFFKIGDHKIRCTVKDSAGRTDEGTIAVTVIEPPDTKPPQISGDETARGISGQGEPVRVRFEVTARDDRDGSVDVTCDPQSGSEFRVGTTTVTCTARDRAGNMAIPHTVRVEVTSYSEIG